MYHSFSRNVSFNVSFIHSVEIYHSFIHSVGMYHSFIHSVGMYHSFIHSVEIYHSFILSVGMYHSFSRNVSFIYSFSRNVSFILAVGMYHSFIHSVGMCHSFIHSVGMCHSFIHSVFRLTTGPKTLPKPALHTVRSRASSFKWEYPLLSLRSFSSVLRHLLLLLRLSCHFHPPFKFPPITRCRRQFLRKMWPNQLAFPFIYEYFM